MRNNCRFKVFSVNAVKIGLLILMRYLLYDWLQVWCLILSEGDLYYFLYFFILTNVFFTPSCKFCFLLDLFISHHVGLYRYFCVWWVLFVFSSAADFPPVLQQQQSELAGHLVSRSDVGRVVLWPPLRSLICLCLLLVPHSPWFFLHLFCGLVWIQESLMLGLVCYYESLSLYHLIRKKKSFMYYQQVNFNVSSQTCDFL